MHLSACASRLLVCLSWLLATHIVGRLCICLPVAHSIGSWPAWILRGAGQCETVNSGCGCLQVCKVADDSMMIMVLHMTVIPTHPLRSNHSVSRVAVWDAPLVDGGSCFARLDAGKLVHI